MCINNSHILHRSISYKDEFMKFQILLDTHKLILSGLFLRRIDRKPTWVYMKYERLPSIWYRCSRLNHETKACKKNLNMEHRFGGWLRADVQQNVHPNGLMSCRK